MAAERKSQGCLDAVMSALDSVDATDPRSLASTSSLVELARSLGADPVLVANKVEELRPQARLTLLGK